jgi:non-ribosomal peptide synthetase component F
LKASRIAAVAESAQVSVPSLLLAAFARHLALVTSVQGPTFGFFRTARSAAFDNIDHVVGPTLNVLPLRVLHAGEGELVEVARTVQDALGRMTAHEQADWRQIVEWAGLDVHEPLCNVFVNVLWNSDGMYEGKGQLLERWDVRSTLLIPFIIIDSGYFIAGDTYGLFTQVDCIRSDYSGCV